MFCRNVHYQLVSCRLALKYYIPSFAGFPLQLTQGPLLVPLTPVWEHNSKSLHLFLASSFISALVTFSISPLCHPVFLSLLPVSLTLNTIRLHRHPLTSSQPRRYPRTSAPNYHHHHLLLLQRACMYSPPRNYGEEIEKPDVNLDSIWSKSEPPTPPGFVILTAFSISCAQELTEVERKVGEADGGGRGRVPQIGSLFIVLCLDAMQLLQGAFFHLFSRHHVICDVM